MDYYVTEDERSSAHEDDCSSDRIENDVTEIEIRLRPASSRDVTTLLNEPFSAAKNENESNDEEIVPKGGADITVPGISKMNVRKCFRALEEGNKIFDLTPPPTSLMATDTGQKKTKVPSCILN